MTNESQNKCCFNCKWLEKKDSDCVKYGCMRFDFRLYDWFFDKDNCSKFEQKEVKDNWQEFNKWSNDKDLGFKMKAMQEGLMLEYLKEKIPENIVNLGCCDGKIRNTMWKDLTEEHLKDLIDFL